MSEQAKITNKTRASFRRAGLRFPANGNGHVIVTVEDLTEEQREALANEPRLEIEPYEAETAPAKKVVKTKTAAKVKPSKADSDHEKAMTAARRIKDPVKRQAAQEKANADLATAQAKEGHQD